MTPELIRQFTTDIRTAMQSPDDPVHNDAVQRPISCYEQALVCMVQSWALYARCDEHHNAGNTIGLDATLCGSWGTLGDSLLGMLDGQLGRLDAETLAIFIQATMLLNDVPTEE